MEETKLTTEMQKFQDINTFIVIIIFCGALAIIAMHLYVPIFPFLFLFDAYLFYVYKTLPAKSKEWGDGAKYERNLFKYVFIPLLAAESFVIVYYHEVTFPIVEEVIEYYIND